MEILENKDYRLRESILNGSSKNLQRFIAEKERLENILIAEYENSYKFMESHILLDLEEIKLLQDIRGINTIAIKRHLQEKVDIAVISNMKNKTKLYVFYDIKSRIYHFVCSKIKDGVECEQLCDIPYYYQDLFNLGIFNNISKNKLIGCLKKMLYEFNLEQARK